MNKNLLIARLAYRDIKRVIDEWEISSGFDLNVHWNGIIVVDGDVFHPHQLDDEEF